METGAKKKTSRLTVVIPYSEYKQLKHFAVENDTTISEIIKDFLQKNLLKSLQHCNN